MAIQYLSGNRATGTASDRAGLTVYSAKSWVELGRTTLSSTSDNIDVTGLDTSDYPFLMVLTYGIDGSQMGFRVNSDTGNNYHVRRSMDGASDSTLQSTKAQVHAQGAKTVSYTHLTLPTICSV